MTRSGDHCLDLFPKPFSANELTGRLGNFLS